MIQFLLSLLLYLFIGFLIVKREKNIEVDGELFGALMVIWPVLFMRKLFIRVFKGNKIIISLFNILILVLILILFVIYSITLFK